MKSELHSSLPVCRPVFEDDDGKVEMFCHKHGTRIAEYKGDPANFDLHQWAHSESVQKAWAERSCRVPVKEIRFFINGVPSPGGSKSAFCLKKNGVYTGRAVVVDAGGKKTLAWRQDVAAAAFQAMKIADAVPLTGAIELELVFQIPRTKSHFLSDGIRLRPGSPATHITRPDLLKLARSTEDSLTGICFHDDGQIEKETLEKFFSPQAGCWVMIKERA